MRNELDENVFILIHTKPTKEDSDERGNVLYYKPGFGWYSGYWQRPHMDGSTHWTYLPSMPPEPVDPDEERSGAFDRWLSGCNFPDRDNPAIQSLLRIGWNAAWKRAY